MWGNEFEGCLRQKAVGGFITKAHPDSCTYDTDFPRVRLWHIAPDPVNSDGKWALTTHTMSKGISDVHMHRHMATMYTYEKKKKVGGLHTHVRTHMHTKHSHIKKACQI